MTEIQNRNRTYGGLAAAVCLLAAACSSPADEAAKPADSAPGAQAPAAESDATPPKATVEVITSELFVDIEAEPDEGPPPLTVQLTATVEDNTGAVECEWDFGDGSPKGSGLNPTHVFSTVEDYEVIARCKDSTGVAGEGEVDVFVEEAD
ncbi:MAG: PKD domain-containing protein [Candidatus Binatia bacterium]|nr:PKD domain-containing protein [Candidatus Binatia bacterium]